MTDSIEELATKLEAWEGVISKIAPDLNASDLRAAALKLRECREALEPFAAIAERDIGDDEADHDFYHVMSERNAHAPLPRVGHFRRAAKALEAKQ